MTERHRPRGEHHRHGGRSSEPLHPIPLPPDLAEFLRHQGPYACLTHATDQGTCYVLKAPAAEIARARGTVPIYIRRQLYSHPAAPVIRTVLSLYDHPNEPLHFESFINVAAEDQRADFAALADQKQLLLLFYGATRSLETAYAGDERPRPLGSG